MAANAPPLIEALRQPACYDHEVGEIALVETHISWVLLTGPYAYKIKKPVDLGFLDFSTLERRRHFCQEELRLNRRLAPQLYLGVVPLTGTAAQPRLGGAGEPIEYAVKMRQFDRTRQLDQLLARGALKRAHIISAAQVLAAFHRQAARAPPGSPFGAPEAVLAPMLENFRQIRSRLPQAQALLAELEAHTRERFGQLAPWLAQRQRDGFVRECHGDAHLRNMVLLEEGVTFFDCIEFSEALRWIDVMSEIAFLVMDLDDRSAPALARTALNYYLSESGDYEGARALRFYQLYRALVRAKVEAIRLGQNQLDAGERARATRSAQSYLELARRYTQTPTRFLAITHGLSGSGKTTLSEQLLEAFDVLRLRSDVERKRLHGLAAAARSASAIGGGIYTAEAGARTYAQLTQLAMTVLDAGFPVIVDAACLMRAQRESFRALARTLDIPFIVLDVAAPAERLHERLRARAAAATDASEAGIAVLERQRETHEPLGTDEEENVIHVDGEALPAVAWAAAEELRRRLPR